MSSSHAVLAAALAALVIPCAADAAKAPEPRQAGVRADAAPTSASARLKALFDEDWEWQMSHHPEGATYFGDHRFDDRLSDASPEAIARGEAHAREMLARV